MARIALVSREIWPFHEGGGLGRSIHALARSLAPVAEVTTLLPDTYRGAIPDDHPGLVEGASYSFVPEPGGVEIDRFGSLHHAWSASVCEALRHLYPDSGPELVEFPEYTGEGAVTIQARRSGDPAFASTRIAVRCHGSDELHRALNGMSSESGEGATLAALERASLRGADVVIVPADEVRATYERVCADTGLAPVLVSPPPFHVEAEPQPRRGTDTDTLRLLHLGRLERRKGVEDLVRALVALPARELTLTLVGGDTTTGPGGSSMREHLERIAAGDERIRFRAQLARPELLEAIAEHDVVVVPSRWECFANTAREAIASGRPVLATPVGGSKRIVQEGVSGWFTTDIGEPALVEALERLLGERAAVASLVGSPGVVAGLANSVDNEGSVNVLLAEASRDPSLPDSPAPRVGVTVIARDGGGSIAETLGSLSRQTRPPADLVVACQGPHAARAAGAFASANGATVASPTATADGDVVAFVEAGTVLAPAYVERVAAAAAADPDAAWITTWSSAPEPGVARPLGATARLEHEDVGGELLAVRRRDAEEAIGTLASTELAGAGPWLLARELHRRGGRCLVIPEELVTGRWTPGRAAPSVRATELHAAIRRRELGVEAPPAAAPAPRRATGAAAPLLSVLMAARDAEENIRGAVESVLGQAEERVELIVVDDGSRIPVSRVLADVSDPRLTVLRHTRGRGVQAARNTGLSRARGEFLAQLDADDVWLPEYATTVLPVFADPEVGLVYSNIRLLGHPAGQELYIQDPTVHPMDRFPKFAEQNPVPSPTATMRAGAVRDAGGWRTWLRQAFDYDLYARLIVAGWRFRYVDRPLGWYRWPEPTRGMSYDARRTEMGELQMWTAFVLRHPRVPGPRRQVRVRFGREARRLLRR